MKDQHFCRTKKLFDAMKIVKNGELIFPKWRLKTQPDSFLKIYFYKSCRYTQLMSSSFTWLVMENSSLLPMSSIPTPVPTSQRQPLTLMFASMFIMSCIYCHYVFIKLLH